MGTLQTDPKSSSLPLTRLAVRTGKENGAFRFRAAKAGDSVIDIAGGEYALEIDFLEVTPRTK